MAAEVISTIWLAILEEQRPVSYREIAAKLLHLPRNRISPTISVAYRMGYLRRSGKRGSYAFAVTHECLIPTGVEVRHILKAIL